jgi:hypothetical protein
MGGKGLDFPREGGKFPRKKGGWEPSKCTKTTTGFLGILWRGSEGKREENFGKLKKIAQKPSKQSKFDGNFGKNFLSSLW